MRAEPCTAGAKAQDLENTGDCSACAAPLCQPGTSKLTRFGTLIAAVF
jgi:hypothetical protein